MSHACLLALDQGTTSSRAIVFDLNGRPLAAAQKELRQSYPRPGWVEHDPVDLWQDSLAVLRGALERAGLPASSVRGLGITNQRETTLLWDRASGKPLAPAIVWQDRRTAGRCRALVESGWAETVQQRTGLIIDPYFSATKLAWLLDTLPGAREQARRGALAFGTVDCFLLWRLTGGRVHATDATNAARTMLFDIHRQDWDADLLALLDIPPALLPEVRDSAGLFGHTQPDFLGAAVPITGMAGDQHAALVGQGCVAPGMMKSTYGTGCFALLNTGTEAVASRNRLLTTLAYRLGGRPRYALEGSIFIAGAAVQWLRDGLGLITRAGETESLAARVSDSGGVYFVPAFTGLGAPYWDAEARGALLGLTRDTGPAQIARAALEAVCYQTRDLLEAMQADGATPPVALRVDGGMVANDWLLQCLADTLGCPVERPQVTETTALGAALLALAGASLEAGEGEATTILERLAGIWQREAGFSPRLAGGERDRRYEGWRQAVARVLTHPPSA